MPGAPLIQPSPGSRRPRSRADPHAATDCSPTYDNPPRNASLAAAPQVSLITRISPQPPTPARRRSPSWASTHRGDVSRRLTVATEELPARRSALKPGRGATCPPTASTATWGEALCSSSGLAANGFPLALSLSWRGQDMLAGRRGKAGYDPQRTKHVKGGSTGEPEISRPRRAIPSASGNDSLSLSLGRGGP